MTVIKCKMCGGELKIVPETSICECEYCGSKQTIPTTDDEKRLKLYERANKLRYENEFDKAAGVYESIVAEYQDEAEAYWGLVLCKYGIEYVDDPKTGKKIPTCHRSSFDSVMDDSDFDRVMENSDTVARALYREEAKQIEELRKGIIEVSSKEEAYDIFICYKETAEDGERTLDSVIAQDVYDALIEKGYKVFFSRITLEDKLGQEYEPYIFAALNSARVMLAFGTTYDYYNAVWVKNEWSRFLQLMAAGQKKILIPCYKNLDAYDMPKEFAKLQAQDMGKVGALQDLLRGIDKIFGRDKKPTETTAVLTAAGDKDSVAKRGYFALEDREWDRALKFFDQALNSDAENPEVHLGVFLAKRQCVDLDSFVERQIANLSYVSTEKVLACEPNEELINKIVTDNTVEGYLEDEYIRKQFDFDLSYESKVKGLEKGKLLFKDNDWIKLERFATGEFESYISSKKNHYFEEINIRIAHEEEQDLLKAKQIKEKYADFLEKTEKSVIEQSTRAEALRNAYYNSLCESMKKANSKADFINLANKFKGLKNYKDSFRYIKECNARVNDIDNYEIQQNNIAMAIKKKRKKRIVVAVISIVLLMIICFVGYTMYDLNVRIPKQYDELNDKYWNMLKQGDIDGSIQHFESIKDDEGFKSHIGYDHFKEMESINNCICETKNINDGEIHRIGDLYKELSDYSNKYNFEKLLDIPEFQSMMDLNGKWECYKVWDNTYDIEMFSEDYIKEYSYYIKDGLYNHQYDANNHEDNWHSIYFKDGDYYFQISDNRIDYEKIEGFDGTNDKDFEIKDFYDKDDTTLEIIWYYRKNNE